MWHVWGTGELYTEFWWGDPSEGTQPLGRPSLRWEDKIKMDHQEVEWGDMDWIGLVQDRNRWRVVVNAVINLSVSYNAGNFLSS